MVFYGMNKKRKLSEEAVINLWNEKRTVRDKTIKIEAKLTEPPEGFEIKELELLIISPKELIKEIEANDYEPITSHKILSVLMEEYEEEIGRNSIWRGKITKQFVKWLEEYD